MFLSKQKIVKTLSIHQFVHVNIAYTSHGSIKFLNSLVNVLLIVTPLPVLSSKFLYLNHKNLMCRTPDMSAMHHDSSADLNVVKTKLKEILEVHEILFFVPINVFQKDFF